MVGGGEGRARVKKRGSESVDESGVDMWVLHYQTPRRVRKPRVRVEGHFHVLTQQ